MDSGSEGLESQREGGPRDKIHGQTLSADGEYECVCDDCAITSSSVWLSLVIILFPFFLLLLAVTRRFRYPRFRRHPNPLVLIFKESLKKIN